MDSRYQSRQEPNSSARWHSRLQPTPIYAQATTEINPSEENGIQLKDNTSSLLAVLLRAVSQLGVLKRLAGYLRQCAHLGAHWQPESRQVSTDLLKQESQLML